MCDARARAYVCVAVLVLCAERDPALEHARGHSSVWSLHYNAALAVARRKPSKPDSLRQSQHDDISGVVDVSLTSVSWVPATQAAPSSACCQPPCAGLKLCYERIDSAASSSSRKPTTPQLRTFLTSVSRPAARLLFLFL
eukprot:m.487336 g.487336  ORF g.487336 m.487336 type:complete len:140 (+) comp24948_c0_seq1:2159-2578(+)